MSVHPPCPAPPILGQTGRILEGVITTLGRDGQPHVTPMGPLVDDAMHHIWLRPYATSTTFENLNRTRYGVFHVTDDVELIARAAVGHLNPLPLTVGVEPGRCVRLADCCQWYAFEVESLDDTNERTSIVARVTERGTVRPFLGFNRAKHAVLEAAILATRIHLLKPQDIGDEFERLSVLVQKTGAAPEHRAFEFLRSYVEPNMTPAQS